MNWLRIDPYAIACEPYTISKQLVSGTPRYTLWEGERMVAIRNSAEELKRMAEKEVESV